MTIEADIKYDSTGRIISRLHTNGHVEEYTYDRSAQLVQVGRQLNGEQADSGSQFVYDSLGRLVQEGLPCGEVYETRYNEDGPVVAQHFAFQSSEDQPQYYVRGFFGHVERIDARGNAGEVTIVRDPQVEEYTYDRSAQLVQVGRQLNGEQADSGSQFVYDSLGRLVQEGLPCGEVYETRYNEDGPVVAQHFAFQSSEDQPQYYVRGFFGHVERIDARGNAGEVTIVRDPQGLRIER